MKTRGKNRGHSLTGRMAVLISIIFCLSVIVIFIFNFFITRRIIRSNMEANVSQTVKYYETEVNSWLEIRIDQLNLLKHSIERLPAEQRTREVVTNLVVSSAEYGTDFGGITDYIVFPDKTMISGDGWVPEAGYDPTSTEYYQNASKGELYISSPYVDATTGEFIITIAAPVTVDGSLYAVVGRDLTISEVKSIVDGYQTADGSYLYLLDKEGNILSHQNGDFQPTGDKVVNVSDVSMDILQSVADADQTVKANDYDNAKKNFLAMTEPESQWVVGLVYPNSIIEDELEKQIVTNLVVFIIALLVSLAIVITVLRKKLLPISQVVKAAENIEKGHLQVELDVNSDDEIGRLANTFYNTAEYLRRIIGEISTILTQISSGNLNIHAEEDYRGDFVRIHEALEKITHNLNDVIGGIDDAADQVAGGATQVADSAQILSQGAVEQSGQIEELVRGMDRVKDTVNENAARCEEAGEVTNNVAQKLEESNQHMHEMVDAMNKISHSSDEIGKIIKTIEDIAFQTNILALNAAVEAARAGEAGKGFAVVADEVRNLAAKSAEAAKNTTTLIETSISTVGEGTRVAGETAESLTEAVDAAKEVVEEIKRIVQLSNEQADEINQISSGISDISQVVQSNSASAEESAATSEELSSQAHTVKALLGRFQRR
ncbi:methyl-accepting chemotaxis protein [Luxibacter massiliensis]|uniref:methyl-accepting chemotaxis protein n=1 Tax=Luxibacter massiliensis TaxID=2219695 RepID=UPI000F071503|nr:methyl-accepting chemotaxis protein [Luxibacter massiliensis]